MSPDTHEQRVPLSFAQQRLWFIDRMQPKVALFNLHTALRIKVPFAVVILERALNEIVRRHSSLRTSVVSDERGDVFQMIAPLLHLPLPTTDLSDLSERKQESEVRRLATQDAREPFDLERPPLLRVRLLRLANDEHVLLMTMHHIISDGWSMGTFWRELEVIWEAFAMGKASPLPELHVQYSDYVRWERQQLNNEHATRRQLEYWKMQLAGAPFLDLRNADPHQPDYEFAGAHYQFEIPLHVAAGLRRICQRYEVTLFMTLFAAFLVLLARLSGETDLAIGTYVAGRNRPEFEPLIGFFLNTLVLRVDVSGDPTFATLLKRVRTVALDAFGNQDVPFARVVEELQPERELNRNPLFEVLFQLLNVPTLTGLNRGRKADVVAVERAASMFDLTCTIQQGADSLVLELEYRSQLFDDSGIHEFAERYLRILQYATVDPDQHVSAFSILSPAEEYEVLAKPNATHAVFSECESVAQIFQAQVKRSADQIALIADGAELHYDALNRRANRLAAYLRRLGVRPEELVGVCLERSFESVTALLAIAKIGAAFLPLDPSYPAERLAFMVQHSRAGVIISRESLRFLFPAEGVQMIWVDTQAEKIAACSDRNVCVPITSSHLAYAIYTSGSTGQPKGVAVECRQILNRLAWMWQRYPFEREEVACHKTRLSFVDSIWEIFGSLLVGTPTVIIPDHLLLNPDALVQELGRRRVSRIWVVPSFLREILNYCTDLQDRLPRLKFWVSSGEELSSDLADRFQRAMPHAVLFNLYGTSEVWDATWYDPRTHVNKSHRVPIGTPISNVEAYVLDSNLKPVPPGVQGELHIGGAGLARGYLHDPEQTAEKFVPNPFSALPGSRLYKTGDLAVWTREGSIELCGRRDHQVKIRGHRVELGEVENQLRNHGGVDQAAVVVRGEQLCGYVTPSDKHVPDEAELRSYLRSKVPECMVPSRFVVMEKMPVTPSGKLNRRALPPPAITVRAPGSENLNDVQKAILELWCKTLGRNSIGLDDNYFDLGGHSLMLVQLSSLLKHRFQNAFSVTDLFRYPTIRSFASFVGGQRRAEKIETIDVARIRSRARKQREISTLCR
jgi:amino acid adenylation domain-containing protein